jgi:hypothetical protein
MSSNPTSSHYLFVFSGTLHRSHSLILSHFSIFSYVFEEVACGGETMDGSRPLG